MEAALPYGCADAALRPADVLLNAWTSGKYTAVDITVAHGWQLSERCEGGSASREKWRTFLKRKEEAKHKKYDKACEKATWAFLPMALGTWGGQGPEGAKLLALLPKRTAGWQKGDLRASLQEELRQGVGLSLARGVWAQLDLKNFC